MTILVAAVIALLLVAGGAMFLMAGGTTPSQSPSAPAHLTAAQIAQDRQAQSDLRNALIAAKVAYTDSGSYTKADAGGLGTIEPSLCYVGAATASVPHGAECVSGKAEASVSVQASNQTWSAARLSASGSCFWIRDDVTVGTRYGSGTECTGAAAAVGATSTFFPGKAAAATRPSAPPEGCINTFIALGWSADAIRNERLASRSPDLSLAISAIMRAADDWRALAGELAKYPRIAANFRVGAARFYAATDAFARGDNTTGQHRWARGLASIRRGAAALDRLDPPSC
jgi:hypothetical protein